MSNLNDDEYFFPIIELEDDEHEEVTVDDDPTEYLSNDDDVSDTEDGIPSQDNNLLVWTILACGRGISLY